MSLLSRTEKGAADIFFKITFHGMTYFQFQRQKAVPINWLIIDKTNSVSRRENEGVTTLSNGRGKRENKHFQTLSNLILNSSVTSVTTDTGR